MSDVAVLVGQQAPGRGRGAAMGVCALAPSGLSGCRARHRAAPAPGGALPGKLFPCGFWEWEDEPKPRSRELNQALQGTRPSAGVSQAPLQGVREFVPLLARIPLAVVQLNAPSEGPGRDFPQSCLFEGRRALSGVGRLLSSFPGCLCFLPPSHRKGEAGRSCRCLGAQGRPPEHH